METNSRSKYITIGAIVAIAIGVFVALGFFKSPVSAPTSTNTQLDWSTKVPEIRNALLASLPASDVEARAQITIVLSADATGDGVPEALVDTGSGGASTDYISLVKMNSGIVSVEKFKEEDGSVMPIEFPQGSAVLHSNNAGIDPNTHSVYQTEITYNSDGSVSSCAVRAYVWNGQSGLFEYTAPVSQRLTENACSNDMSENLDLSANIGKEFRIEKGQTYEIAGTDYTFMLSGFYDHPCQKDVQCIWSGLDVFWTIKNTKTGKIYTKDQPLETVPGSPFSVSVKDSDYNTYAVIVLGKSGS